MNAPTVGSLISPRPRTLGVIIRAYKAAVTSLCRKLLGRGDFGWQRNYCQHIIRTEEERERIRQYIRDNPLSWDVDEENPARVAASRI